MSLHFSWHIILYCQCYIGKKAKQKHNPSKVWDTKSPKPIQENVICGNPETLSLDSSFELNFDSSS